MRFEGVDVLVRELKALTPSPSPIRWARVACCALVSKAANDIKNIEHPAALCDGNFLEGFDFAKLGTDFFWRSHEDGWNMAALWRVAATVRTAWPGES